MPQRVYIIAEAGVNHNGSLDTAKTLVDAAAEAGADCVKFQTFSAKKLISGKAPMADYQKAAVKDVDNQHDLIKKLELDVNAHAALKDHCQKRRIEFLSTPFDLESVDLLVNEMKMQRLKIGSGDVTNAPLLLKVGQARLPIILSTGMSTLGDIEAALGIIAYGLLHAEQQTPPPNQRAFSHTLYSTEGQAALNKYVTLLHCTTEYPAPFAEVNLRVIKTLQQAFMLPVGFSDHTSGINIPLAAVALGACVIEKHFTLDRNQPGPDHKASLVPEELTAMVEGIRQIESALGNSRKGPTASEIRNQPIGRRSVVAAKPIKAGTIFTDDNITTKRPGTGISAIYYYDVLGKPADKDYVEDDKIDFILS